LSLNAIAILRIQMTTRTLSLWRRGAVRWISIFSTELLTGSAPPFDQVSDLASSQLALDCDANPGQGAVDTSGLLSPPRIWKKSASNLAHTQSSSRKRKKKSKDISVDLSPRALSATKKKKRGSVFDASLLSITHLQ